MKNEANWLHGYATIYDSKSGKELYQGKYKAPCLSAILFTTFDLELENFESFVPRFT